MMIEVLARVAALTGERDRAIASLQAVLDKPYAGRLARKFTNYSSAAPARSNV